MLDKNELKKENVRIYCSYLGQMVEDMSTRFKDLSNFVIPVQMLDSSYYYVTMGFVVQLCFALSFACTVVFRLSKLSSV